MTESQVLAELFRITGELTPVGPAPSGDLATLRRRLAESLFAQSGAGISSAVPADPAKRPILEQLQAIVDDVAGAPLRRCRVLRRELPLRSAHQPASFPSRSGGQAIQRTFTMLEREERFVFFDLCEAADLLPVNFGTPHLLMLLPADAASENGSTTFGAGSVWIKASLFGLSVRGFVGLRVAHGALTGSAPTAWSLNMVLDPPTVEDEPEGLRQDAGRAVATRPQSATFVMEPAGMRVEAAEGSLSVYGAATTLTRSDEAVIHWEQAGSVLIPFESSERELRPTEVHSKLLQPAGVWKVGKAGWLLPISPPFLPPDYLGDAADAGAMAIVIEDGLTAAWPGLVAGPYAARRATIAANSSDLTIVADGRTRRIARQELALWRNSWIDLHFASDFRLHFASSRGGAEAVFATVPATAHLDRPLQANGRRPRVHFEAANVSLFSTRELGGDFVGLSASRPIEASEIVPLAISNALLKVNPPDALTLWGALGDGQQVTGATLRLAFGLRAILPFLPDPYAADFAPPADALDGSAKARLTTAIVWGGPLSAALASSIAPSGDEPVDLAGALLPDGLAHQPGDQHEQNLRRLVERTLGGRDTQRPLQLLDLSSNADQFGVRTAFPKSPDWRPLLTIDRLHLVVDARNLRLIAPPQVQWEPVRTHPSDLRPGFPQPLLSKNDGGPLEMGVADDTVHLVPMAPRPVLQEMIAIAARETASAAIKFTLPFGIKAVAAIADDLLLPRPSVALNQPVFGPLAGGLQISMRASTPEGMPGGAIQTSHGTSGSNVLDDVAAFFNDQFDPQDEIAALPLSRIDLSGYGASSLSQWVNEEAAPLAITKVEFEVLVGRTSVEVVEAQSILWPCMARVVRRITIRREGDGAVLRRDSGWVAATPGLFERPDCACTFHPGPVLGMFDIREIRETTQRVRLSSNVDLQAVYFDTDIAFANVVRGHRSEQEGPEGVRIGFVPAHRQLGFVQLINPNTPQKTPLTPAQLAELLSKHGPVGGPVDCELDIGGSQQRMRLSSLYSAVAPAAAGGAPQFAIAVYGAPELPREGQWRVVRMRNQPLDSPEPEPVDSRLGVPLVRVGRMFTVGGNPNPFRFADPADLLSPAEPAVDYALLLATQTFRVLFPRVKIRPGSNEITSDLAPVLADALAMTAARGLFPRLKHAISFPTNSYSLKILGSGQLRLDPAPLTQTMPMPPRKLDLVKAAGIHAFTEYCGGSERHQPGPSRIELRFDSTTQPSWGLTIGPVSTVTRIDPFGPLMRLISTLEANSDGNPKATKPLIEYGGALSAVEELITVMKEFGIPEDLLVETPNSPEPEKSYKFKAAAKIELNLAEIFGMTSGKLLVGIEVGSKRTLRAESLFPPTDPLGSLELFAEIEGKVTKPVLGPICAGGLFRLEFIAGYDPSERQPAKLEIKFAVAVMISVGGELIPKLFKVEGQVHYGYMLVLDYANGKVYPGVLLGFQLECEIKHALTISIKAEVIGLVKRIDDAQVLLKAELSFAVEIELFDLVDVEYTLETEWEQKLPIVAVAALALAIGIPPAIPP